MAIYQEQYAAIRIHNDITKPFKVEKGTRQRCPLSPLLFILCIEFLLIKVRKEEEIRGLKYQRWEYKIKAYADDLVLILKDPIKSLPKAIKVIEEFGCLTGFYLNQNKSKILLKNITSKRVEELKKLTKCEIVNRVDYLGITMSPKNINLFKNNFEKIWDKIDKDMKNWKKLKLSFFGKIVMVKMKLLPKVLFCLQNIPIIKDIKQFDKWQTTLQAFI